MMALSEGFCSESFDGFRDSCKVIQKVLPQRDSKICPSLFSFMPLKGRNVVGARDDANIEQNPLDGVCGGFTVPSHAVRKEPEVRADFRFPIHGASRDDLAVGSQKDNSRARKRA